MSVENKESRPAAGEQEIMKEVLTRISFDDAGRVLLDGERVTTPATEHAATGDLFPFQAQNGPKKNKNCIDMPIRTRTGETSIESRNA